MRTSLLAILLLGLLAAPELCFVRGEEAASSRTLCAGTPWATEVTLLDSGHPGPVVAVIGGMHGNEPAGARAAAQIRHWKPSRGRLIVLPRANARALAVERRRTPGVDAELSDLNRNFPAEEHGTPRGELAAAIWSLLRAERVEWLLDLHEGFDFHRVNAKSVGSSVIVSTSSEARRMARILVDEINRDIEDERRKFDVVKPPVDGSLARAARRRLGIHSFILETTTGRQPLSLRVRQHRILVHRCLEELGMVTSCVDMVLPETENGRVKVGLYDDSGSRSLSIAHIERALGVGRHDVVRIGAGDIAGDALESLDLLIVAGGRGSTMGAALGKSGREALRSFVKKGGGYLGLSAGAYLASRSYEWSLGISACEVLDRKHWKRGSAPVAVNLTPLGLNWLESQAVQQVWPYRNGPVLGIVENSGVQVEVLATYGAEVRGNDAVRGLMLGSPVLIFSRYGAGRVICSSASLESSAEGSKHLASLVERARRR